MTPRPNLPALLFGLSALTALPAAQAQYKVVMPDGSITYTDRPPLATNARVTSMSRRGTQLGSDTADANAGLPADLRLAAQRYPVTLYSGADCAACDTGRRLLQQRGVPYAEKRVSSDEDALALERLVGARLLPALTIGAQPLRGLSEADWTAFLDAAGYPKESKLPRNWQVQPVQQLVEKTPVPGARPQAERTEAPVIPELPQSGSGPRF